MSARASHLLLLVPAKTDAVCETSLPQPSGTTELAAQRQAAVEHMLATMSLEQQIGQMLMAGHTGTTVDDDRRTAAIAVYVD